ncbi:MAG: T9SS type A sorting domain-containing protein [Cyclobacteriaceae bacterium]
MVTLSSITDSGANGGNDDNVNTSVALGASTVTITSLNDEPALTGTANSPGFTEGGTTTALWSSTAVSTIEAGQTITEFVITVSNVADGDIPTNAQDETSYDRSLSSEGSFEAGSGYVQFESITMSDGTVVTVDLENAGEVVEFTINSAASSGAAIGAQLTQSSSSGSGTGFALTPNTGNLTAVVGFDEQLTIDDIAISLENLNSGTGASGTTFGSFDYAVAHAAGTSTVTISSITASTANVQTVLNGIIYSNGSDNPSTTSRVVTVTSITDSGSNIGGNDNVNDASIGLGASTVAITGSNDPPVMFVTPLNPTFSQGSPAEAVFSLTDVNTIEGDNVISFVIEVTNVTDGTDGDAEILNIDGIAVSLEEVSSGAGQTGGNITFDYDVARAANTSTITVDNFSATEATMETVFNSITYENTTTPTNGTRGVNIASIQDAGGGTDTNAAIDLLSNVAVSATNPPSTLSIGDIVVIGISGDNQDEFTWVPLVDIPAGEVIYFTNSGHDDAGNFVNNSDHWVMKFTSPGGGLAKGTIQNITDDGAAGIQDGTGNYTMISSTGLGTATDMWIYNQGDQILVFQSTDTENSTFTQTDFSPIFALTSNSTVWEYEGSNANDVRYTSDLYTGLTNGTNAIAAGAGTGSSDEYDNTRYTGALISATRAQILAAVTNISNWTGDDADGRPGGWTTNSVAAFHINEAPLIDALVASNPTFTENAGAVGLFTGADVNTVESGQNLIAFEITVTNVADGVGPGQDETITLAGVAISLENGSASTGETGLGGTFDYTVVHSAGTSTITVDNFTATEAVVEAALNGMTYNNASEDPSTTGRGVSISSITDTDTFSSPANASPGAATSTVAITALNDEPTLTATGLDPNFTEGGAAVTLFSTASAGTVEAADAIIGFTITVTNATNNSGLDEFINVDGQDITLQNANSGTGVVGTVFGTFNYSVSNPGGTAVITISAISETTGDVQTVIDALTYDNNAIPPTAASRVISINDLQDDGGSGAGNDDINNALTVSSTVGIIQNLPSITDVLWLDANPVDGNIDQVQLTFDLAVDFTDTDGANGTGLDIFSGIVFSAVPDYAGAPYQNVTSVTLDLATPIAGTSLPANTLTYTTGATNATILRNGTGLELTNGEVGANGGTYTDGAAPVIIGAVTDDNDNDGTVDRLTISFSESITLTDGGTDDDFSLVATSGTASFVAGVYGATSTSITYIVSVTDTDNTGLTINPTYVTLGSGSILDAAGSPNEMVNGTTFTGTDGADPVVINDVALDTDGDGDIDALELQFSENITDSDITPGDFELSTDAGSTTDQFNTVSTIVSVLAADVNPNDDFVRLSITTPANVNGTGASQYDYTSSTVIDDAAGNQLADFSGAVATDGALPVVLSAVTDDNSGDGTVDRLTLTFSETVTVTDGGTDDDFSLVASSGTATIDAGTYGVTASSVTYNITPTTTDNTAITISPAYVTLGAGSVIDAAANEMADGETVTGTDGAAPAVIVASTGDNNGDGTVDRLVLTFSESVNVTDGGNENDFTLTASAGTATIDAGTYSLGSTTTLTYNVTVSSTNNTTLTIDPAYVVAGDGDVTDLVGNEMNNGETVTGVDGAPTVLVSAVTDDNDGDGTVDRLTLTFSETVTYTDGGTDDDFTLTASSGTASIDAGTYSTVGTTLTYNVTVTAVGNTALTIDPTYLTAGAGSVVDGGAIEMVNGETVAGSDGAAPAVLIAATNDNSGNGTVDQVILTFSESVTVTDGGADNDFSLTASSGTATIDAGTYGTTGTQVTYNVTVSDTDNTALTIDPVYATAGAGDVTDASANEMTNTETVIGIDGAAPAVLTSVTNDNNLDGTVDQITLTFSESVNVTDGGTDNDFSLIASIGTATINSGGYTTAGTSVTYNVTVTDTDNTALTIDPVYATAGAGSVIDLVANEMINTETVTGTDGARPAILVAETGDNSGNGTVDRLILTFSESVTVTDGGTDNDFTLVASSGTATIDAGGYGTTGTQVTYNVTVSDTDNTALTLDPTYVAAGAGNVTDASANEMADTETITGTDSARPAILSASTGDNNGDGTVDRLVLTFSESVTVTDGGTDDDFSLVASTGTATIDAGSYGTAGTTVTYNVTVSTINNTIMTIDPTYVASGFGSVIDVSPNLNEMANGETVTGIDGAPAVLVSAVTGDNNRDGTVDRLIMTFSETVTVTDGGTDDDFSLVASTGTATIDAGSYGTTSTVITYNVTVSATGNTALIIDPVYVSGGAGNVADGGATEVANGETITGTDGAGPAVISSATLDADTDGRIDGMTVTLSEAINDGPSTIGATTFDVATYTGEGALTGTANDASINVTFSEILTGNGDSDAVPNVTLNANVLQDALGNMISSNQIFSATQDGAAPAITDFEYQDGNEDGFVDQFVLTFSEPLDATSTLSASNLSLVGIGDFTSAAFGGSVTNQVGGAAQTTATVPLGTVSSVADTESTGLSIGTQGGFNLTDGTNSNNVAVVQSWATFTDGAAPVISGAVTIDTDSDGQIDGMTITFTENIADGSSTIGGGTFDVEAPYTGESAGTGGANDNVINLTFSEGGTGDTGITPDITLNAGFISDGTNVTVGNQLFTNTTDGAAPAIFSAEYRDFNGSIEDGTIDRFVLTYSESVTAASTISASSLLLSNVGDFTSAAFGASATDLIASNVSATLIVLGTPSSVFDTEENSGAIEITTQAGFSLVDGAGNINSTQTAQSWVLFIDGAAPLIAASSTVDSDRNGQIDGLTVTLSEDIVDGSSTIDGTTFTVTGYTGLSATSGTPDDDVVNVSFTEGVTPDTDATPNVTIVNNKLSDGTSILNSSFLFTGTTDGAGPAIISSVTDDTTEDGEIDFISVVFSEDIESGTVDTGGGSADLSLSGGYTISSVAINGTDGVNIIVNQSGTPDTDVVPNVVLNSGQITDLVAAGSNAISSNQTFTGTQDGAGPAIISAVTDDSDGDGQIDLIDVTLSEDYDGTSIDASGDFSVTGYTVSNVVANSSDGLNINLTELGTPDTDAVPNVILNAAEVTDALANSISSNQTFTATSDGASPVVVQSRTLDNSANGNVDEIELEFSEPIVDAGGDASNFTVTPPTGFGAAQTSGTFSTTVNSIVSTDSDPNDEYISLTFTVNDWGTGIMTLNYSNNVIQDPAGNNLSIPGVALTDLAAPRVIDQDLSGDLDLVPLDDATGVVATSLISLRYSEEVIWDKQPSTNRIFFVQQVPPVTTTYADALNDTDVDFTSSNNSATSGTVDITTPTFEANAAYYIIIEDGAFVDAANNPSANQFNTASAWDFVTETALTVVGTSADLTGQTVTLNFNASITINTIDQTDFVVTDGLGRSYPLSAAPTIGPSASQLTFSAPIGSSVGDLAIDYTGVASGLSDITAGVGTLQDFVDRSINSDTQAPVISSATTNGVDAITLNFNDAAKNIGAVVGDFSVVDGAAASYAVTAIVDSIADNTLTNSEIRLEFADISNPSGDLFITFTNNGGNGGIGDYGNNRLATETEQINLDSSPPTFIGATIVDNTTIELDFDENVRILSSSPTDEIQVIDEAANEYSVSSITTDIANDDKLRIKVQNFTNASGDITININPAPLDAGLIISDFGGNSLPTSSFTMDVNYNPVPTVTEIFTANNASGDSDQTDVSDGSGVGMYRSTDNVAVLAYTPINIVPRDDGHTITIYRDAALTQVAYTEAGVIGSTSPTLQDIFETNAILNFGDGTDDNGVFTFYITETSTATPSTQGPAIEYSIALLDDVANSAGGQSFGQSDSDGTTLTLNHPATNQTLQFSGNGLALITYLAGGVSSTKFIPSAAGNGSHQLTVLWKNQTSGTEAPFTPTDLLFTVSATSAVFDGSQDVNFGRNETTSSLVLNPAPTEIDIAESPTDGAFSDFHDIEVYHILNGAVNTSLGVAGTHNTTGGNIASTMLTYSGSPTINLASVNATSIFGWTIDPSAFQSVYTSADNTVDTLLLVSIAKGDGGGSPAEIGEVEVYLFPDPTVGIVGINSTLCEDDGLISIEASIFTFPIADGGVNATNPITNGYLLQISNDNGATFVAHEDFTSSGVLRNNFDTSDPNQDGDTSTDETGFYRIIYTSEPQTNAGTTNSDTLVVQVIQVATAPVLDETVGNIGDTGGFDGTNYVFEFCRGESIPDITIDISSTPADIVAPAVVSSEYNWYESLTDLNNGNPSFTSVSSLTVTDIYNTTSPPTGTTNLYVTRTVSGCESDYVEVIIRIYENPLEPDISTVDNVTNNKAQNIAVDRGDYFFEYCADQSVTITPDVLNLISDLEDNNGNRDFVEQRSYFNIYNDEAGTDSLTSIFYDALSNYSLDFDADLGANLMASGNADGVVTRDYYITKVVADSTYNNLSGGVVFSGCESDPTKFTISIYTYPDIPDVSSFTGDPNITNEGGLDIVNYYMCSDEEFPDVGVDAPTNALEAEFVWYADAGLTDTVLTANGRGEVVSQSDLVNHGSFSPASLVLSSYTYYVRLVSNVNPDSDFEGCEGSVREVRINVLPTSDSTDVNVSFTSQDLDTQTNVGNFDYEFNFCVNDADGLDANTAFTSAVDYITKAGFSNEILWFGADENGTTITSSNAVTDGVTVTALDLKIQNQTNDDFEFAILHRADFIDGYNGFDGCLSDTTFVRINVSSFPEPQFTFQGITEGRTTSFDFSDLNSSNVAVGGVLFEIFDASDVLVNDLGGGVGFTTDSIRVDPDSPIDYQFSFATAGTYRARLTITTDAGCIVFEERTFSILQSFTITDNVRYDFESTTEGWFAEFQSADGLSGNIDAPSPQRVSTWEWGNPDGSRINDTQISGGNAWATTGLADNRYRGGEVSYIYSPSFDFSTLTLPAIKFKTYRDFDGIKDGVVFQYSTNDGLTWQPLGQFPSSGQNWYNANGISSVPGNEAVGVEVGLNAGLFGWTGSYTQDEFAQTENGWVESTHSLSGIIDRSNVRFRFALSATGITTDPKSNNGFAFDDMEIFELEKTVLIEQFSSTLSESSYTVDNTVLGVINPDQVLWINYFTDLANRTVQGQGTFLSDALNNRNKNGPGARALYYGIEAVPTSVLDGDDFDIPVDQNGNPTPEIRSWSANDINIKELEPALFTITDSAVAVSADGGTLTISATFNPQIDTVDTDLSFTFAIVERVIEIGATDDDNNVIGPIGVYDQVGDSILSALRVLLPGPIGFNHTGDISRAQPMDFETSWVVDNIYRADQMRVIMFVQDNITKEVLQSAYIDVTGASETVTGISDIPSFSIYPNPADKNVTIEFENGLNEESQWILYDQAGREVLKGITEKGTRTLTIDTEEIPSGVYLVNIFNDSRSRKVARVIVVH